MSNTINLRKALISRLDNIQENICEKLNCDDWAWYGKLLTTDEFNNIRYIEDKAIKFAENYLGCTNVCHIHTKHDLSDFSDYMGTLFVTIKSPINGICKGDCYITLQVNYDDQNWENESIAILSVLTERELEEQRRELIEQLRTDDELLTACLVVKNKQFTD